MMLVEMIREKNELNNESNDEGGTYYEDDFIPESVPQSRLQERSQ